MQIEQELVPAEARSANAEDLRRAFDVCVRKTRRNIKDLADHPKTWSNAPDGEYSNFKEGFFEIGNWTSSFFTGMALLAWQQTKDQSFLREVLRLEPAYRDKVFVRGIDTHHDLGFLYTLYSVALYKLTGNPAHREVGLQAAEVLAQRFNPIGKFIRAWGHMNTTEQDNMAIIDCLMNLPLLYWASRETGSSRYRDIAVQQADLSLDSFIRGDDSVYHAYRFDLSTGKPLGGDNYCGHSVNSYWARGTSWAIYGMALSYSYTQDSKYLETSVRLARKFISQLDSEVVPVWDFRLPPGEPPVRDASAAVIAACGFQEMIRHGVDAPEIVSCKDALLKRVCMADYLDTNDRCRGVLKSAYGNKVAYSSWGDYFLMEALARELFQAETWW